MNDDVRVARAFHDRTAHSRASVRTSAHVLDWDIKPFPFKVYTDLPALPLPRDFDPVAIDALAALGAEPAPAPARLTLERVAALLYFSAGVTKKKTYPGGGEVLFRAAASTGALFQTEVYLVAGEVDGLAPGLYHFCPGDFALRRLREGDVRGVLAAAAADESLAHARRDDRAVRHLLAQHVEVPGARVSPPLLGLRHHARQPPRRGRRPRRGAPPGDGLRRRRRESTARPRRRIGRRRSSWWR